MLLKVSANRTDISDLRQLISKADLVLIYSSLKDKAKTGNNVWSTRAQGYESKLDSGNVIAVAERTILKHVLNNCIKAINFNYKYIQKMYWNL